jgi:hypothetical protein
MELLQELLNINERIYSTDNNLIISIQHSRETSEKDAISTFIRRNPYQSHLPGINDVDIYSILNYVSSEETTKLLQSMKGRGPYSIKPAQLEAFLDEVSKHVGGILQKIRPDTIIVPKSSSPLLANFTAKLKTSYPKAKFVTDAFIKKALDAENVEPLVNKDHPDWEKFETDHPKEASDLRKSLARMIKTTGQLEIKKLYKPYAKFIKNFVEIEQSGDILEHLIDKKVLILDDILSSGITMQEMIRQIKEFEAKAIYGLTIFKRTSATKG